MDMRRKVPVLLVVLLLAMTMLAVAGCGGGDKGTSTGSTDPAAAGETAGQAEESAKVEPAAIGEETTAGDWTIKVTKVERAASAGGGNPTAGNELVVITFDVTNDGKEGQGIGPTSFKLVDAEGTEYPAASTSDPTFIFNIEQPIKPGETRQVLIAYDVKPAAGPFTWTFEPFGAPSAAVMAFD